MDSYTTGRMSGPRGNTMRLGILFPVAIFIVAVIFLGWFFVGGYASPGGA